MLIDKATQLAILAQQNVVHSRLIGFYESQAGLEYLTAKAQLAKLISELNSTPESNLSDSLV